MLEMRGTSVSVFRDTQLHVRRLAAVFRKTFVLTASRFP